MAEPAKSYVEQVHLLVNSEPHAASAKRWCSPLILESLGKLRVDKAFPQELFADAATVTRTLSPPHSCGLDE